MSRKYTYNEVVEVLIKIGYVLLDKEYINARTLMNIKDLEGYLYQSTFGNLLNNSRPRIADTRNPYSIHNINLWLILNNKSFKLLSETYIGKDDNSLLWNCNVCNHKWNVSWHPIYSLDRGCPNCAGNMRYTYEFIKSEFQKVGYLLLNQTYKNVDEKLTLIDSEGYLYYSSYYIFQKENKILDKFSKFNPYTIDNIKLWVKLNNKPFELLSYEYENNIVDLKWKCNICNQVFYNAWVYVYCEGGCNLCTISKGENKIKRYFDLNSYDYNHQYIFDNCRNKRVLPFDFYLPKYNICIEFQGKQHYEPINYFGGEDEFKNQNIRDQIKRDYCKTNNIKLIEIPYWNFDNIEKILLKEININNKQAKAGELSA